MNREYDEWPPRPDVFPEVLTTVETAQLLRLDESCETPESGARAVLRLVKHRRLPTLRRVGRGHRFGKAAVLAWAQVPGKTEAA